MKKQLFLISTLCVLLSACGVKYTDNNIILKAESLLNDRPDSAFNLLKSISNPEQLPKPDYAAWCLHYTHAQYKLFENIKSDSLIKIAADYYADSKLYKYSGTSYYLLGCVSELLNQNKKAILAYKNAYLALEGTNELNIFGLTNLNMGYVYVQDRNYFQADICFRKSLEVFIQSRNKKYQISSCLEISNMSLQLEAPFDTVIYYSNKALDLCKEVNDTVLRYHIISRQGELLSYSDKKTAINNLLVGFNHIPELRTRNASFLAYLYSELSKPDSALFYLQIANKEKGDSELEILKDLANGAVSENRKDFRQAYYAFENAYLRQDTIFRNKLKDQLYRIDKQFDVSEKEKENAELEIANRTKVIWIALLIILVLIILLLFQRRNIQVKKKQEAFKIDQQKLEFELKEKEIENTKNQELLLSKLQQRTEMNVRFNKLQQGFNEQNNQAEFIKLLTNQVILSKREWETYINEANSIFNNKITYLKQEHIELTTSDLIVIVLITLGLDISDSCVLLNMSKDTMYVRRKRIKKHLGLDNEIDLDEWIKENIN